MTALYQAIVFVIVATTMNTAYPVETDRSYRVKIDPFVALTNTLREEDLQQQRRPFDYETEDNPMDMWQVRQLQNQMGKAAMMMPYFQRDQRNWELDNEQRVEFPQEDLEEDDYGVPVMSEEEGQLYRDSEEPIYSYYPKVPVTKDEYPVESQEEEEEAEEKRLLMDTLVQYMYLSGSDNVKRSDSRKSGQKEVSTGSQQKNFLSFLNNSQLDAQQAKQHITQNNATSSKMAAEDELIQQLDTLKPKKN